MAPPIGYRRSGNYCSFDRRNLTGSFGGENSRSFDGEEAVLRVSTSPTRNEVDLDPNRRRAREISQIYSSAKVRYRGTLRISHSSKTMDR